MLLRPNVRPTAPIKPMINVGCLFDIATGSYVFGKYGESILNGGVSGVTGVVGAGNLFKSTILHYKTGSAMARIGFFTFAMTYDTEINIHEWHLHRQMASIREFKGENPFKTQRWVVTDKTVYTGDQFYDLARQYMEEKVKNVKSLALPSPFVDRDGSSNMKIIMPSFIEYDSLTEFSTKDVIKMQDDNSLGDSGANMIHMRQGNQKTRMLMELPGDVGQSNTYVLMTAHVGTEFVLDPYSQPMKKLAHLKAGTKIKGVPEKFTFVTHNCWQCVSASPLMTRDKTPEFPIDKTHDVFGNTDMNAVVVRQLRSKSGISGMDLDIIVSQTKGVLPEMSEFYFLKTRAGRFGFLGDNQNYSLAYCPDIKLSRTTVYRKIEESQALRRSLNFLAEHAQIILMWMNVDAMWTVSPEAIYKRITELGYDWEVLYNTRGWWTVAGMHMDQNFLSTLDLIRMYHGNYIPYWMDNPPAAALEFYKKTTGVDWQQPQAWISDRKEFQKLAKKYEQDRLNEGRQSGD